MNTLYGGKKKQNYQMLRTDGTSVTVSVQMGSAFSGNDIF
jgi:hypothetical protein